MNPRAACLVVALSCVVSSPARGIEPWKSEHGDLEVRAFYKTWWTGLRMPRGLVEASEALEALTGAPPVPLYGLTSSYTGRIWGRLSLVERVELHAGWQLDGLVASDPAFVRGSALAPIAISETASRRLIDFDPVLAQEGGLRVQHNLDLLALKVRVPFADFTVGRQVLSWGSGRLWNPTDLLSPFAPTDIDREVRRGIDALRMSIPLAATAQLELLYLPQLEPADQGAVIRAQSNIAGFDIAPSVAKYVDDAVFGLDVAGDIGPVGIHGEAAWTSALGGEERFLRAVAGLDMRPIEELVLTGEYYFNGWGADDPSGYVAVLRSARVTRGEVFGAGRHYLGLVAAWQVSDLLNLQAITITNLQDPSVLLVPAIEYWAHQRILLRFGNYLPIGRAPDPAPFQSLTPSDGGAQTEAWQEATSTLGIRSEYGAAAFGVFAQLAIHLL